MLITPPEYEKQLEALEKALGRKKTIHVNTADEITRVRAVVTTWFQTLRPLVASRGLPVENLEAVDVHLRQCMGLTLARSARSRYRSLIQQASRQFKRCILLALSTETSKHSLDASAESVVYRLSQVSPTLAARYRQVHLDLGDKGRLSYRGTANELRETLRELLERLAPDEQVIRQPWYKPIEDRREPTQQQRARYTLETRGAGSRVQDVANGTLTVVEEGLAKLVRDTYSRTSLAAHTSQDIEEIRKILRHFDALVHDLCG